MSKSIIDNERECLKCGTTLNLEKHHIYGGANRKVSEKFGCWVYLCNRHHTGSNDSAHRNPDMNRELKEMAQIEWERRFGTREDFIRWFGKSYL